MMQSLYGASNRLKGIWPGLTAVYAWRQPFEGFALTIPNRIEVVFSSHSRVALEQDRIVRDVSVVPGGAYVVGANPTTLWRVDEHSDTLEMYPDMSLLNAAAEQQNVSCFELEPTLGKSHVATFFRDAVFLAVAHRLRRACLDQITLSDIEASDLAHTLAMRLIRNQYQINAFATRTARLGNKALERLSEYVEANLDKSVTIDELACVVNVSPFHFARCFKKSTGLTPHQYVLARRIDCAKRMVVNDDIPIQNIAWDVGFENINHFRHQFQAHFGVTPGQLRRATRM
jgi:AraC family transcriptional regulator